MRAAFGQHVSGFRISVEVFSVESGVDDQPWTETQTRQGALNRAVAARDAFEAKKGHAPDFSVGLGGCALSDSAAEKHPGVEGLAAEMVHCFAWIAVCSSERQWGLARTASFVLPPRVVALMRNEGMELGEANGMVFGDVNSKQKGGSISKATRGVVDRTAYYEHALHCALAPFLHAATDVYDSI